MIEQLVKDYVKAAPVYKLGATIESVQKEYGLTEIYKLGSNENQLGVSPLAIKAMVEAAYQVNYYPEGKGIALREKLAKKFGIKMEQIMITEGGSVGLIWLGEVFIKEGDEVLICKPTYGAYQGIIRRNNGKIVEVPLNDDLSMDFEGMLGAITDKTKMIMICNPNNPTGVAADDKELYEFIKKVPKDIIILVDEAYIQFVDKPGYMSMISAIRDDNTVIVVQTFSKLYGMAGARVGYLVSNQEIIKYMQRIANFFCTNKLALAGAEAALDDREFAERTLQLTKEGRDYLTKEIEAMGYKVYPSQTNFIYCDLRTDPYELSEEMKKYGVIIRGNFELTRITVGLPEQNKKVIEVLKKLLKKEKL